MAAVALGIVTTSVVLGTLMLLCFSFGGLSSFCFSQLINLKLNILRCSRRIGIVLYSAAYENAPYIFSGHMANQGKMGTLETESQTF